jgi:serine/threonine-protein kinase HipA
LSPAYDLLATQILIPADTEDSALPINGRKSAIAERDFRSFAEYLRLNQKQYDNVFARLRNSMNILEDTLSKSFVSEHHRRELQRIVRERAARIGIVEG